MTQTPRKGKDFSGITVVYFCHDGEGNILMNKRSQECRDEQGTWDCGGGGLEFGQTIEQTLRDEVFQEYGAAVLEFEELGRREVFREQDGEPTHWIAFDFLVRVDRSQVRNGEPHKFEAIEWFKPDTLPSPLHSQLPFTLAKYQRVLENLPIAS